MAAIVLPRVFGPLTGPISTSYLDDNYNAIVNALFSATGTTFVTFQHTGAGMVSRPLSAKLNETLSFADSGAVGDGAADDAPAFVLSIAYFAGLANPSGASLLRGDSRINTNGGLTITATHGLRWLGEAPAYTVGAENAPTRIDFYGTGSCITLNGILTAQSAFTFENIRLENKGHPQTNNGIQATNAAFAAGLQVIGAVITQFSSGVYCNSGQPYGYVYAKNSAFYYNATWGLAIAGNIIDIDGCAISNNGPLWSTVTAGAVISSGAATGLVCTITTSTPHGLNINQTVTVAGCTPAAYNGKFVITPLTATTFSYNALAAPGGPITVVGTYSFLDNTFNAAPVGGGLFIEGVSTNVCVRGGTDFEGMGVAIFVRNTFGVKVEGSYFESISKAAVQATTVGGLEISGNYMSTNYEARTIMLRDCSNVRVGANGYSPNVFAIGLTDYDLEGCNLTYIDTNLNRAVQDTMFCMKAVYASKNVDLNDNEAGYLAVPSSFINMTGPVLQAEIGPYGCPINRYTTTVAGGYFIAPSVVALAGQYLYFSILVRNATIMQAIVRDTTEANPIVIQTLTQYNKEWSVLTVGGLVGSSANPYRLTLVNVTGEVFDVGGLTYYLRATPLRKQAFSFATYRRIPNRTATLAYSASMTPNPALGNEQVVTVTNGVAFALLQPTVIAPAGDELMITIINTSGGALGVATFTGYKLGAAWTQPANGFTRSIRFRSNGTLYREVDRTAADVSN